MGDDRRNEGKPWKMVVAIRKTSVGLMGIRRIRVTMRRILEVKVGMRGIELEISNLRKIRERMRQI